MERIIEEISFDECNFQLYIGELSDNGQQINLLKIDELSTKKIQMILDLCAEKVKNLNLSYKGSLMLSELFKILNSMPNLEALNLKICDGWIKPEKHKIDGKLNLKNLRTLIIKTDISNSSIYEFFTNFLPENLITEHQLDDLISRQPLNDFLYKAIRKFFDKQKSIKKIKTNNKEMLKTLNLLTLDELEIGFNSFYGEEIASALESQPRLKKLTISCVEATEASEAFGKLTSLENFVARSRGIDFNKLKNLANLKSLETIRQNFIGNFDLSESVQWSSNKFENLEKLILPENSIETDEILEAFPNLKILNIQSSLKLNSFVKLQKLQHLTLSYEAEDNFDLCELDTGSFNESLIKLEIIGYVVKFWKFAGNVSEVNEIFLNLEEFSIAVNIHNNNSSDDHPEDKKFFSNFSEWKSLKTLKISNIPVKFYEQSFDIIAEELKELASKVQNIQLDFQDRLDFNDDWEKFTYRKLTEALKGVFNIMWRDRRRQNSREYSDRRRGLPYDFIESEMRIVYKQQDQDESDEEWDSDEENEILSKENYFSSDEDSNFDRDDENSESDEELETLEDEKKDLSVNSDDDDDSSVNSDFEI